MAAPSILALEAKQLLSTFTVSTASNDGPGSLRQAILAADAQAGPSTIDFAIGHGAATILPTSPLPTITGPLTIDGTSQPGYAGTPLITVDGTRAGVGTVGLAIGGNNAAVRGLAVDRFYGDGVVILGNGNTLAGDFIGLNAAGTTAAANRGSGVIIRGGSNNTIGGTDPSARDVISGNGYRGVWVDGSKAAGNLIQGDVIGTDASGTVALGNGGEGVAIINAPRNTVGGAAAGAGDLISGNGRAGVLVNGNSATGDAVQGDRIGTDATGIVALGNGLDGVTFEEAPNGTVGGAAAGAGNLISGNNGSGVQIHGNRAHGDVVQGNTIGTAVDGNAALPNAGNGVSLFGNLTGTVVGNLISGNGQSGVILDAASGNVVAGNRVGTNAAGTARVANYNFGVDLEDGSTNNTIGGTTAATRDLISGNRWDGVRIDSSPANAVQGDWIGLNAAGTAALVNGGNGVELNYGSDGNLIGGTAAGAGNVISGNARDGVSVLISSGVQVQGNEIGTDAPGGSAVPNALSGVYINSPGNTVGGTAAGARNVISGNASYGVWLNGNHAMVSQLGTLIKGGDTSGDAVLGNFIGTDANGGHALGNGLDGVYLDGGTGATVGGAAAGSANVLSGNGGAGLRLASGATLDFVLGNSIGTDAAGDADLVDVAGSVAIDHATGNTIDGNLLASVDAGIPGLGNTVANNRKRGQ